MFDAKEGLPTPIGTLDQLLDDGDTSAKPHKVFVAHNLGNRAFLMIVPMHDFYSMSMVANDRGANGEPIAQRKLDEGHAQKLAIYIIKGLVSAAISRREIQKKPTSDTLAQIQAVLGKQPFLSLQPIVANIRNCEPGGSNLPGYRMEDKKTDETACFKVMLSQKDILYVVDGQHRRKAMDSVFDFLNSVRTTQKYPKKGSLYPTEETAISTEELEAWSECLDVARGFCTIAVEVHLGLGVEEERQLFHDLNNLAKKVESSLALQFDSSNPVNLYIKEVLFDDILGWDPVEKDIVNWQDDTGQMTRKDIVAINAHLFLNKSNISSATPSDVEPRKEIANRFWHTVNEIPGFGQAQAKLKTVAAQPVVLKALAKLTYDFAFNKRRGEEGDENLERLLSAIPSFDFSHSNPIWRYYEMDQTQRRDADLERLAEYLPSESEGFNRDIGKFEVNTGVMRFGAKHNDIFPIIGDMVRWKLRLPNRNVKDVELVDIS
jgi:hypothetical protein